jgi:putative ABC transport system substrate-binding protein
LNDNHAAIAMKRRVLLSSLALAAMPLAGPVPARAQQRRIPTIGFIAPTNEKVGQANFDAFVRRFAELGWRRSDTVEIDLRWAEGQVPRAEAMAAEFARRNVDVLVTASDPFVQAAARSAPATAIVSLASQDPVGTGQVRSLAHPGGNVTGLAMAGSEIAAKRLEIMRELIPGLQRIGVLGDYTNPVTALEANVLKAAGGSRPVEIVAMDVRQVGDIAPVLERHRPDIQAIYAVSQPIITANAVQVNGLALAARLPTMHGFRENAAGGGLVSYGADLIDLYRRGAEIVDKVLRGARPADIPVEQPTRFTLVIDLATAKALGLSVPPLLITRADEVIE